MNPQVLATHPELIVPRDNASIANVSTINPAQGPEEQEDRSYRLSPPNYEAQGPLS